MYNHELKERIRALENKIKKRDEYIAEMIAKNNSDKLRLSKLKLSLEKKIADEAFQRAKARPKSPKAGKTTIGYHSLSDCEHAGLYNKIVLFPVAKCKLHNCYLDFGDVRVRKCVMRMCKHMEWINENTPE